MTKNTMMIEVDDVIHIIKNTPTKSEAINIIRALAEKKKEKEKQ
jgi:hypothetical protein